MMHGQQNVKYCQSCILLVLYLIRILLYAVGVAYPMAVIIHTDTNEQRNV